MKVFLNGTEVPYHSDSFQVVKEINRDDFVIEYTYPQDIEFMEHGYKMLLDLRKADYTQLAEVDIQVIYGNVYKTIIEGHIRLTNIEFDHKKCVARTKVKQRDFLSRILNGWDKETSVTGGVDVDGNSITTVSPQTTTFTHPFDDSAYGTVRCFDFLECIQYYVNFLTSSSLTVHSVWYDNLPDNEKISITSGENIRTKTTSAAPVYSLENLYKDHAKAFNLLMGIVYNGITPVLRIEPEDFWYSDDLITSRNELLEVKDRFNEDLLYSTVKIGSTNYIKGDGTQGKSFPDIPFFSFANETFTIEGSATNNDQQLDLTIKGIIDSNIIEDIIENASTTYDNDIIYIQTDIDGGFSAWQPTDIADGAFIEGKAFFNAAYQKNNQIDRFNFQGNVSRFKKLGSDTYLANYLAAPSLPISGGETKLIFPNDSISPAFDTDGNWNTSTSRYTAPSNDLYLFRLKFLYRALALNVTSNRHVTYLRGMVKRFNSSNVLKKIVFGTPSAYYLQGQNPFPLDVHFVEDYYTIFLQSGDYVEFYLYAQITNGVQTDNLILVSPGSLNGSTVFQESACESTKNAGGIIKVSDPESYRIREWEFDDQLATSEIIEMIRQPQKGIGFAGTGVNRKKGHGSITVELYSGAANFKLLTNVTD